VVNLLPAQPKTWQTGKVTGLRARGGLQVDLAWKDGRATAVKLRASVDGTHTVKPPARQKIQGVRCSGENVPFRLDARKFTVLKVEAGSMYELILE
jgi:alpha-L-fucosidase 2